VGDEWAVCAGRSGIAWEHAWGDGVAILNFFNEVYDALNAQPVRDASSASAAPEAIRFAIDGATAEAIAAAGAYSDKVISECDLDVYRSESMTKEHVKRSKLSPDGLMQMVMQLAHYRVHKHTPSTYESASTAGFKHGRTETIRSATPEAVDMCKTFLDASATEEARFAALK
jgi:carnitine O-palmitoyltransferase 2